MNDFSIVVDPADHAKAERRQQHDPDIVIAQISPQQGGDGDGDENKRAAHGWRTGFDQMGLRAVVAYRLSDLIVSEFSDHCRPDEKRNGQGRHACQYRAQCNVAEDVKRANVLGEILCECVEHG